MFTHASELALTDSGHFEVRQLESGGWVVVDHTTIIRKNRDGKYQMYEWVIVSDYDGETIYYADNADEAKVFETRTEADLFALAMM